MDWNAIALKFIEFFPDWLAASVALGALWWAMKEVPRQLDHFRTTRTAQRREEVAEEFFVASARYASDLANAASIEYANAFDGASVQTRITPMHLERSAIDAMDAFELARLHGVIGIVGDLLEPIRQKHPDALEILDDVSRARGRPNFEGHQAPEKDELGERVSKLVRDLESKVTTMSDEISKVVQHRLPTTLKKPMLSPAAAAKASSQP